MPGDAAVDVQSVLQGGVILLLCKLHAAAADNRPALHTLAAAFRNRGNDLIKGHRVKASRLHQPRQLVRMLIGKMLGPPQQPYQLVVPILPGKLAVPPVILRVALGGLIEPPFISHTDVFQPPGLFPAVFLPQPGHFSIAVKGDVFQPGGCLPHGGAAYVEYQIRFAAQSFA